MAEQLNIEELSWMVETVVSPDPEPLDQYDCATSTGSYDFVEGDTPKYFIPSLAQ